jgi:hypothetical protein
MAIDCHSAEHEKHQRGNHPEGRLAFESERFRSMMIGVEALPNSKFPSMNAGNYLSFTH